MADNIEFIESKRGGRLLCMNGFIYQKKRQNATHIYWYCSRRDKEGCRGAVKTLVTLEGPVLSHDHNHEADERRIDVGKAQQQIRTAAENSHDRPAQIRLNALTDMPAGSREELGSVEAVRQMVGRRRRHQRPQNVPLHELTINGIWAQTLDENPENFLLTDNQDERERVIAFCSPQCLRTATESTTWYMDGNFSVAPPEFLQLYVIRVKVAESAVTAVYALMQRKTQASYECLLRAIIQSAANLGIPAPAPLNIHCDFEMAVHQAVRQVFPQCHIRGCFYHLTQSTWRKIQDLGLTNRYNEEEEVKAFAGMLDGLAFLPEQDVPDGMRFLRNNTPQGLDALVDYMDTVYVTGRRQVQPQPGGALVVAVQQPPLFPIPSWNVHELTAEGGDRTNNFCESWNVRVKALAGVSHPSVWKLIELIKKEDVHSRTLLTLHARGEPPRKRVRQETRRYNARLVNLVVQFRNGQRNLEDFLRAIGHNIRFGVERQQE